MGLHAVLHKSKKQRRLEAMFDAEFGKQLRHETPLEVVQEPPSFKAAQHAWQLQQQEKQKELEAAFDAEFAKFVAANSPAPLITPQEKPKRAKSHYGYTVVYSVTSKDTSIPFRWVFLAPERAMQFEAEHLAKIAMRKAGLKPYCHIDTFKVGRVLH